MLPVLRKRVMTIGLALEMIDFQNDTFGQDMEQILTSLQEAILARTYRTQAMISASKECKDLTALIWRRLKMKVDLVVDNIAAAILPFYSNKNHIFLDEVFRGNFSIRDQEKILKAAQNRKGTVNNVKAQLGGIFSEYENILYINFADLFFNFKMSPSMVTAIILHELGHGFYACEYADRLESNNQPLANVAEVMLNKKENKDVVYIYRELQTINSKVTEEEVDKIVNGNKVIAGATFFRVAIGAVEEQMKNNHYSRTSFEQMADNFASRFGYGKQLILALDRLHGHIGSPEKERGYLVFINIMSTMYFMMIVFFMITMLFWSMLGLGLFMALLAFMMLRLSGEDCKDYTYDELKVRYQRVRNDYIEKLKSLNVPSAQLKATLEDVYRMDRCINETHRQNLLLTKMANFLFANAGNANDSIKEQQLLEELTFNDLFLKSAELRTL